MGLSLGGFIRDSLEIVLKSGEKGMLDDSYMDDNAVHEGETEVDLAKNHDRYLY